MKTTHDRTQVSFATVTSVATSKAVSDVTRLSPLKQELAKNRDVELVFRIGRIFWSAIYSTPWADLAMFAHN